MTAGGGRGEEERVPKCVGRSNTCEERASENFYDTLAAFMSRVNLANSASFAPRHLAPRGLSSFLGSLAARNALLATR